MGRGRPQKSRKLDYGIKIMVDKATFDKLGRESAERGISIAEIFRQAYAERCNQ